MEADEAFVFFFGFVFVFVFRKDRKMSKRKTRQVMEWRQMKH